MESIACRRTPLATANRSLSPERGAACVHSKAWAAGENFALLGIPTVNDRAVQAAVKNIMEPIFEADFYPTSHGFRPGQSPRMGHSSIFGFSSCPRRTKSGAYRSPYQWAVEGDIKGCFDHISHHGLMERVRSRIRDAKVNRLVLAFLKAGVLAEGEVSSDRRRHPKGGILSPLLANIALAVLDERYERHVPSKNAVAPHRPAEDRGTNRGPATVRPATRIVRVPIRYADDFIISHQCPGRRGTISARAETVAHEEKAAVAALLRRIAALWSLSEAKTLVTPVTGPMKFLGHNVRVRDHYRRGLACAVANSQGEEPSTARADQDIFRRSTIRCALSDRLRILNPLLRGWA